MLSNKDSNQQLAENKVPAHVAVIMDGNGRWAKKRFMPRIAGHKAGMDNVQTITTHASHLGIKVLSLYAFSTENWKRPTDEVDYLMHLPGNFFDKFMPELIKENVKVNVMGFLDELPSYTLDAVNRAQDQTKDNTGLILNFALNYGSRREITAAVQKIATQVANGDLAPEQIDESVIDAQLMTGAFGAYQDPDLLIRTSGEERLSNFLLWQLAYSELVFTDEYWPDFTPASLDNAIAQFQSRHRRYGGLTNK
ncbi:isoprenyl transferase [Agrilactobacillus yilanensis]|uniref:Isoprenyl transferase n=1 Tax=Agrilactobacillus yilanensis TaxID=2485997 RepID=A0ABW4J8Z6_9LACO|nr:isoprenyl transferase [Agrilactobacillus yilanensis]